MAEIPDDRRVAEAYSKGLLACKAVPEFRLCMEGLLDRLCGADGLASRNLPPEAAR
jgi:hypothetical protein